MEAIDLISFLNNYYGIAHEKLSFNKLTHEDILELFPYITVGNQKEITIEEITRGNIIGVYDKTKRIVYYHNPHLELEKVSVLMLKDDFDEDEKIVFTMEDLENLSKEELLILRRKLRLNNQRKESYMVNALIKKLKKKEPKEYRERKEKLLIKERMNYDD